MVYSDTPGTVALRQEMVIRKKMAKIYNKREDDFPTLREYNDYLEEVEDLAYNWVAGVNVEAIKEKVEQYRQENAELIALNEARKAEERSNALRAAVADTTIDPQNEEVQAPGQQLRQAPGQQAPGLQIGSLYGVRQPRPTSKENPPPKPPPMSEEDKEGQERRRRAGGWDPAFSSRRSLQELMDTLFL